MTLEHELTVVTVLLNKPTTAAPLINSVQYGEYSNTSIKRRASQGLYCAWVFVVPWGNERVDAAIKQW